MTMDGTMGTPQKQQKRFLDADCRPILERLMDLGMAERTARTVAVRLWNRCGSGALHTIQAYVDAGWTHVEIFEHHRDNDEAWRKSPLEILESERMFCEAGLTPELARRLVIRSDVAATFLARDVTQAIAAFREAGLDDRDLREIVLKHPLALVAAPELIRAWRAVHKTVGRALASAHPLVTKRATRTMRQAADLRLPQPPRVPTIQPPTRVPSPPSPTEDAEEEESEDDEDTNEDERAVPATSVEPEPARNWMDSIRQILNLVAPLDDDEERERLVARTWMWDGTTPTKAVLEELSRWVSLPKIVHATNKDSPVVKFYYKIFTEERFNAFLRLDPNVATFRLAVVRRFILEDRALTELPGLLTVSWEKVPANEIRYRVNLLESLNMTPRHRDTIRALVEPERKKFHELVDLIRKNG